MIRFGSRIIFYLSKVANNGGFPLGNLILLENNSDWLGTEDGADLIQE